MGRLDLVKERKDLYRPPGDQAVLVEVDEMHVLMIDGAGDPNTSEQYHDAVETLYTVSYMLKFAVKRGAIGVDYKVMPLEGLWWTDDMRDFSIERKDDWRWTMMIAQPAFVAADLVEAVSADAARKKNPPALERLRFDTFSEGLSAQIMHVGPYSTEGPTVDKLHAFITEQGYVLAGRHHEIYLGDPRRTAPERLRTVIRQPVARA